MLLQESNLRRLSISLPKWEGWHLIGVYDSDVGSWLLESGGQALLLEIPEGLTVGAIQQSIERLDVRLKYAVASHEHADHLDEDTWVSLAVEFPGTQFIDPARVRGDRLLHLGNEPLWLIKAPKHSLTDVVALFRGVAMTGDIELGMLESVNREVPKHTKRLSMQWLQDFPRRSNYHVHTVFSAHLNDVRENVDWPSLFQV